jgi:Phage integrase, N-terminal SAM-like domain
MSSQHDQHGTTLRQRMIEDMTLRKFSEKARTDYIRHVRTFAAFLGRPPDSATPDDLRRFQLHQSESGLQPPTINSSVAALRFFFNITADRPELARHLSSAPASRGFLLERLSDAGGRSQPEEVHVIHRHPKPFIDAEVNVGAWAAASSWAASRSAAPGARGDCRPTKAGPFGDTSAS